MQMQHKEIDFYLVLALLFEVEEIADRLIKMEVSWLQN